MPIVPFTSRTVPAGLGQNAASPSPPPLNWGLIAAAQMHSEGRLIEPQAKIDTDKRMKRKIEIENSPNTWYNTDDMRNKTLGPKNVPGEQVQDPEGQGREVQRI